MTRPCTVCSHPQRHEIDLALILHAEGYRAIAGRYGLVKASLQRHEADHLAHTLEQSKELKSMLSAENLLEQVGEWHQRMIDQYKKADAANAVFAAASVARVGLSAIESFAKLGPLAEVEERLRALEQGSGNAPVDSAHGAD